VSEEEIWKGKYVFYHWSVILEVCIRYSGHEERLFWIGGQGWSGMRNCFGQQRLSHV
jgi:hypothetical protein